MVAAAKAATSTSEIAASNRNIERSFAFLTASGTVRASNVLSNNTRR